MADKTISDFTFILFLYILGKWALNNMASAVFVHLKKIIGKLFTFSCKDQFFDAIFSSAKSFNAEVRRGLMRRCEFPHTNLCR